MADTDNDFLDFMDFCAVIVFWFVYSYLLFAGGACYERNTEKETVKPLTCPPTLPRPIEDTEDSIITTTATTTRKLRRLHNDHGHGALATAVLDRNVDNGNGTNPRPNVPQQKQVEGSKK